ncbi:MAG: hypothetical protein AAB612_00890, partial [Patescibacteria group bacterium]
EFLLTKGFPEARIDQYDPDTLEYKRSFALTKLLEGVLSNDWPNMVSPSPTSVTYASERFPTQLVALDLIETAADNLDPNMNKRGVEKVLGRKGEGALRTDVFVIGEIFDFFKEMKQSQFSPEKMRDLYYEKIRGSNMLDRERIEVWAGFPKLLSKDGVTLEQLSLGELFFTTFKEILLKGREWDADTTIPGWKRPKKTKKAVHVPDPKERNLRVYAADGTIARGHTRVPLEVMVEAMPSPPADRTQDAALFPESDAGSRADVKANAIARLRYLATKAIERGNLAIYNILSNLGTRESMELYEQEKRAAAALGQEHRYTLSADIATILAYQLAVLTGESDFQDAISLRPVGKNIIARLYQAFLYAQKTNSEEQSESKTNLFICGRILAYIRSFLKFAATDDGKTLEQAIITGDSWNDVKLTKAPSSMTQRWSDHIYQGFGEYIRGEGGLQAGQIFQLAEINFAEGRVTINQKVMKDLHGMLRDSWEYWVIRDMSPTAVRENWEAEEIKFTKQQSGEQRTNINQPINPTAAPPNEEFALVTVAGNDGTIIYEDEEGNKPFFSRVHNSILVSPGRLGEWVNAKNSGQSGPGREGKKYNPTQSVVVIHQVIDAAGRPTGQTYKEIIVRLAPGVRADEYGKNKPSLLMRRLLIEYTLSLICMPGDTMARLEKKDIVPLGIFLSKEIREDFLKGDFAGYLPFLSAKIGQAMHDKLHGLGRSIGEFLLREDPGIYGLDSFSKEQYFNLLEIMGYKISAEDYKRLFSNFSNLASGGAAVTAEKKASSH